MNKTPVYLTIVLLLSGPVVFSALSGLSTSSVNIACSGTLRSLNLNNAVIIYGPTTLSDTEIQFAASHFNLLICYFVLEQSTLQRLKTENPNMLILGYCDIIAVQTSDSYWSTVNANENWFLHDVNGNRIVDSEWGWYLMDVSSGWRQFYSSYVNNQLNNSLFDGVFADDADNQLSTIISWGVFVDASTQNTLTNSDIPSSAISSWHSNMIGMLQYVEANILPSKKVIINTNEYLTHDYLDVVDGKMDEGFVYAGWWDLNDYPESSSFNPIDYVDAMARDSATGKIFVSDNGAIIPSNPNSTTLAQEAQNANYCYAATLLGLNGSNCYFTYNGWWNNDGARGYYPIMDANLGSPSGSYYQSQSVYMRDFRGGKVLVNPSAHSYNVILGQNYYLMNGTAVLSIVLGSWSGEILLSQV